MTPFPPATKAEWLAKAQQELKGKNVDWSPATGWTVSPFAHVDDLPSDYPQPFTDATGGWTPGVSLTVVDVADTNREILQLLQKGAGAVRLSFKELPDFEQLFAEVVCAWVEWHFVVNESDAEEFLANFGRFINKSQSDTGFPTIFFESSISSPDSVPLREKVRYLSPVDVPFRADDSEIRSEMNTYREWFASLSRDDFRDCFVPVSISDNYLLSIAKLRALNMLHNQRRAALGLPTERSPIVAHVGPETFVDDEHTNKIRATAQAMAAVVGGAKTIFVNGSDAIGTTSGTAFNRRISLNVQHLLQMESHLERHPDPAAGSYYLEQLTQQLLSI